MLCNIDKDKNTQALASIDEHFTVQTSNHRVMGGVKGHHVVCTLK